MADVDRLHPQNLEAEVGVLGSMVLDPTCITGVRGIVRAEDFYAPDHQCIFAAVCDLADAGRAVDLVTVVDRLRERGELERVGGADFLVSVLEQVPSSAHALDFARIVAERAARRRQIAGATQVMRLGYDLTSEPEERTEAIQALAQAGLKPQGDFDLVAECLATDEELFGQCAGTHWTTGSPVLDDATGGCMVGRCLTIGGKSQHCKTALACNLCLATCQGGGRAVMFRYEETSRAIYKRLASLRTGIAYGGIRGADQDRQIAFRQGLRDLGTQFKHLFRCYVGTEPDRIPAILDREKPCLVVYDTLQAMATQFPLVRNGTKPDRDIAHHSGQIRKNALDERFSHQSITISQLLKDTVGLPTGRHLRQSGSIEEDADTILFVWWPYADTQTMGTEREFLIRVWKARDTGCKRTLGFDLEPGTQKLGGQIDAHRVNAIIREHGSNAGRGGGKKGWFAGGGGHGGAGAGEEV